MSNLALYHVANFEGLLEWLCTGDGIYFVDESFVKEFKQAHPNAQLITEKAK